MQSHNTAIARKKPSSPLLYIEKSNLLKGSVLDYGCGKGADERYLKSKGLDVDSYDPYWNNVDLKNKKYDTILCTYVLNVVTDFAEQDILKKILGLLNDGGKAYLTVRRDIKKEGETSRGFQRNVTLNYPVVKEYKGNYCIYEVSKPNSYI